MNTPTITSEWLNAHLNDPHLVILDASPKSNKSGLSSDYIGKYIPNSYLFDLAGQFSDPSSPLPNTLPQPEAFAQAARELGICQESKIVVYDNLGIYASPRVWWMFKTMGHAHVSVLDGGLPAWIDAGYETATQLTSPKSTGDFQARFNPSAVKYTDDILTNLDDQSTCVIDARSEGRFCGTAPEPREGLSSGHIPHSINIPFEAVLQDGHFKSPTELKKVFEEVGNKPLIFSCGSGLTACIVLLAHELIDPRPKSVYDGSWTEWALSGKLPIAKK
ncbi:sulfurtransferase [Reichenbachiella agarivorans]|uniref:Sulfurtransferase n=1 Tax=Reichenbachiella agarivorans TaxID=2979464 RepID=A0ABY6CSZ6_9BACT|nr:sulfurtransferase [Reichenbachiella agarivorans]UXP32503.1 sulfurtransferase [Reichenbachiella agarivorans]